MSNLELAIELCIKLYNNLSPIGIFPALTGGTLYKEGERKDIDLVIYTTEDLTGEIKHKLNEISYYLDRAGLYDFKEFGAVTKCMYKGIEIDLLFAQMRDEYDQNKVQTTDNIPLSEAFPCPT